MKVSTVWTPERVDYLRTHYVADGAPKIAAVLGLSTVAVQSKARKLRLQRIEKINWQADELQFLRDNRQRMSVSKIAAHLGRTVDGVRAKLRVLQLCKRAVPWTAEEDADLTRLYTSYNGASALQAYFGRSVAAIIRRAQHLGLRATIQPRFWSPAKVEEFRGLYASHSNADLAARFGVTVQAVGALALKLKLRKNPGVSQAAELLTKQVKAKARAQVAQKADYRAEKRKPCGLERKAGTLKAKPAPANTKPWYQYPRGSAEYKAGEAAYFANKQARSITDQYGRPATVFTTSSNAVGRR